MKTAVFETVLNTEQCHDRMLLLQIKKIKKKVVWDAADRKLKGGRLDSFNKLLIQMISDSNYSIYRTFVYFEGEAGPSDFLILKESTFKGFINPKFFNDEGFAARACGLFHDFGTLALMREIKMNGKSFSKSDFKLFSDDFEEVNGKWTVAQLERAEARCYKLFSAIPLIVQSC